MRIRGFSIGWASVQGCPVVDRIRGEGREIIKDAYDKRVAESLLQMGISFTAAA